MIMLLHKRSSTVCCLPSYQSGGSKLVCPFIRRLSACKLTLTMTISIAIQRLHRNYFARAVIENPANLCKSVYAPSFWATFHSTSSIIKLTLRVYNSSSVVMKRLHSVWGNVVICGVCQRPGLSVLEHSSIPPRLSAARSLCV